MASKMSGDSEVKYLRGSEELSRTKEGGSDWLPVIDLKKWVEDISKQWESIDPALSHLICKNISLLDTFANTKEDQFFWGALVDCVAKERSDTESSRKDSQSQYMEADSAACRPSSIERLISHPFNSRIVDPEKRTFFANIVKIACLSLPITIANSFSIDRKQIEYLQSEGFALRKTILMQ